MTANAVDMSQKKVSFKIVAKAQADEGHGEEAGMMPNDEIIVIDPLTDQIIKRIEMGTDLHLAHVVLTADSNYAIAAAQTRGVIYKINAKTYEVEKEINTEKAGNRTACEFLRAAKRLTSQCSKAKVLEFLI